MDEGRSCEHGCLARRGDVRRRNSASLSHKGLTLEPSAAICVNGFHSAHTCVLQVICPASGGSS